MGSPAAHLAAGLAATLAAGLAAGLEGLARDLAALGASLAAGLAGGSSPCGRQFASGTLYKRVTNAQFCIQDHKKQRSQKILKTVVQRPLCAWTSLCLRKGGLGAMEKKLS